MAGKNTLHEAVVGCAGFELPAGTEAGDDGEKRSVELSNGSLKLDKIGVGVETRDCEFYPGPPNHRYSR